MAKYIAFDDASFDSTAIAGKPSMAPAVNGLKSLVKRFVARARIKRQSEAESEVARFINDHGGVLTDDLERQISREFGSRVGRW
jgi:hypothetical protein